MFSCAPRRHQWRAVSTQTYPVSLQENESESLTRLIDPYRITLEGEMAEYLGTLESPLTKRKPESSLGNWMVDVVKDYIEYELQVEIDLSITNYGGIRIDEVSKGKVTVRNIYELMPFDNKVVFMDMDYQLLNTLFDKITSTGGWPISEGWQLKVREGKLHSITYHGEVLDTNRTFKVLMNDYIATGGSDCDFLEGKPYEASEILYRNALIDGAKLQQQNLGKLTSNLDNRIIIE